MERGSAEINGNTVHHARLYGAMAVQQRVVVCRNLIYRGLERGYVLLLEIRISFDAGDQRQRTNAVHHQRIAIASNGSAGRDESRNARITRTAMLHDVVTLQNHVLLVHALLEPNLFGARIAHGLRWPAS